MGFVYLGAKNKVALDLTASQDHSMCLVWEHLNWANVKAQCEPLKLSPIVRPMLMLKLWLMLSFLILTCMKERWQVLETLAAQLRLPHVQEVLIGPKICCYEP